MRLSAEAIEFNCRGAISTKSDPVNFGGCFEDVARYRVQNAATLQEQLKTLRATAQAELSRAVSVGVPVTRAAWAEWFHTNEASFMKRMLSATADRRQCSRRLEANPKLQHGVKNLQPLALVAHTDTSSVLGPWRQRLKRRRGWHAVKRDGRPASLLTMDSPEQWDNRA